MSATISQPVAGQRKSAAPFGAVALLAGVVALGAIGIAVSQGVKTAVPAGPDIQVVKDQDQSAPFARPTVDYPDQIAARLGTASTVTDYPDQIAARLGGSTISKDQGAITSRALSGDGAITGTGPQTAAQKGLVTPDRWSVMSPYAQGQLSQGAARFVPLHAHPARHVAAD